MPGRFIETCSTINEKQLTSKNMQGWKRGVARTHSNIEDGTFCENSYRLKAVNFFRKVALSKMFDWVPNTLLFLISFIVVIISQMRLLETFVHRCSSKYVFLKISEISQENICAGVSFKQSCKPEGLNFIQKRLQHRCFPAKSPKFLRTPSFTEHLQPLLLDCEKVYLSTFVSVLQNYHWKNLMMTVKDKNCIGFLH